MYGFNILISQYVETEFFEKENVSYIIKVPDEIVDSRKIIDPGILISIIDTYSSFSTLALFENEDDQISISVSLNLKINSFSEMYANQFYRMKVFLRKSKEKIMLFEILITDLNGRLIKTASHLKKKIRANY